jgi:hypothetical protein
LFSQSSSFTDPISYRDELRRRYRQITQECYEQYRFILNLDQEEAQKTIWMHKYCHLSRWLDKEGQPVELDGIEVMYGISHLIETLNEYYGKKVFLFIDDFDSPFHFEMSSDQYHVTKEVLTYFMTVTLRNAKYLNKTMLVGVIPND